MNRFSIMERQRVGGFMRLIIMDWEKAEILTLMAHEIDDDTLDDGLVSFIKDMLPILEKPLWKSSMHNSDDTSGHIDAPHQ